MTSVIFFLILGFVQTQKTIVVPKTVQIAGFGLLFFWVVSLCFKEEQSTLDKPVFERRQVQSPKSEVELPILEELSEMSSERLFQLFQQAEKTGNQILADLIRDMLITRFADGEAVDCKQLLPKNTYIGVVVKSSNRRFWVMLIESPEYLEEVRLKPYYLGSTNIKINDGVVEVQEKVFLRPDSSFPTDKIRELVTWFMEDLGYK